MKTGFSFNYRHCSEFGVIMKTSSRPIHPEMKRYTYESPLMDGTYDFSMSNSYGRAFYRERTFVISMMIFADNIYELQKKISKVSEWLTGEGVLIFDDMENVEWKARVINEIDYAPERRGRKAVLSVAFNVEPFSFGHFILGEDITLDEMIRLDAAMPLDWGYIPEYYVYSEDAAIPPAVDVINIGTWYVKPQIAVNVAGCSGVSISCGKKTLTVMGNQSEDESFDVIIDFENQTVTDANGNDLSGNVSGEFFELAPGENTLTFENYWYDTADIQGYYIKLRYVPKYIYDFDEEAWEAMYNAQTVSA